MQEIINPDLTALREVVDINTLNISRLEGIVSQLEKRIDNPKNEMRELRNVNLSGRIDSLNTNLIRRIDRLEERIEGRFDRLETEMNNRIDENKVEFRRRCDLLEDRMNKMSDSIGNIYKWMIGLILPIWVAIGIALIKFLFSGG